MEGKNSTEGRVEIFYDGQWGGVCLTSFGENEANVLCRQLGFSGGDPQLTLYFGYSENPMWLDNITCTGDESTIFDCMTTCWGCTDCRWWAHAGVICGKERPLSIRMVCCIDNYQQLITSPNLEKCCPLITFFPVVHSTNGTMCKVLKWLTSKNSYRYRDFSRC